MRVLVRFSYAPGASFSEEFIWSLHASFSEEFSSYIPLASFTDELYIPVATFSEEFLLHSWC